MIPRFVGLFIAAVFFMLIWMSQAFVDTLVASSPPSRPPIIDRFPPAQRSVTAERPPVTWTRACPLPPTTAAAAPIITPHGTWQQITATGAPTPRTEHKAVWTGSKMLMWGGVGMDLSDCVEEPEALPPWHRVKHDGALYDPASDRWTAIPPEGAPLRMSSRSHAVWTGADLLVWGESLREQFHPHGPVGDAAGGRYHAAMAQWSSLPLPSADANRLAHGNVIWTGQELLVWTQIPEAQPPLVTGARFDPTTSQWRQMSITGAPPARHRSTIVWTDEEMIVWGGMVGRADFPNRTDRDLNDGAAYNPRTDTWRPISLTDAPVARRGHRAIWAGAEMLVWSGERRQPDSGPGHDPQYPLRPITLTDGGWYNPKTDRWRPLAATVEANTPGGASITWADGSVIVWGGSRWEPRRDPEYLSSGSCLNVATKQWHPLPSAGASGPVGRYGHSALWTGSAMLIWGGGRGHNDDPLGDGWSFTPPPECGAGALPR